MTVCGCWAPYPAVSGACSSYLVELEGEKILLDCGHGSFAKLQQHINFRQLSLAIVSHFHPDHYMDLSCLRHAIAGAIRDGSRGDKLNVVVPDKPEQEYNKALKMADGLNIITVEKLANRKMEYPGIEIFLHKTNHPLPTYATTIIANDKKMVYSADTGDFDELIEICKDADLLICEASLLEQDAHYGVDKGHLTAKGAARIAKAAGVKKLMLTHLWPEYDLSQLLTEAQAVFENSVMATEGMKLNL